MRVASLIFAACLVVAVNALAPGRVLATSPAWSTPDDQHSSTQPAQEPAHEESAEAIHQPESAAPTGEAHTASEGHEAGAAEDHESPGAVLMHHVVDQPLSGWLTKHLFFFLFAAGLVLLAIRLALRSYDKKGVPSGIGAAVESIVLFIRDELADKNIGHGDGVKFTPLLCSFFFFILFAALLGLIPFPVYREGKLEIFSATATGNIAVTMALAVISFFAQQYAGISKNGLVGHFKGLVPPGLPVFMLPIMIPVEIIGMFTKPFALMVRLFANMLAGHMMVGALLLLIPLTAGVSHYLGVAMIPISLGLALFIMVLEVLVAFIQAYIFTLLTSIFIGMYVHPAH